MNLLLLIFLRTEIYKHYPRLSKISGMTVDDLREAEFQVCKDITFISKDHIKSATWIAAEKLVANVDPKDTHYIAYSKHFRCKIWSGDKALIKGLAKKGVTNFISTDELYNLRQF